LSFERDAAQTRSERLNGGLGMASVELYLDQGDGLPGVCLCCGQATKQFYKTRLYSFLGKGVMLEAPLCTLHK
jgi:hypothetical protein